MEVAADHAVVRVAALAVRRAAAVRVVDLAAALAAGDVAVAVVEDVAVNQVSAGVRAVFSAIRHVVWASPVIVASVVASI